jgi:hypothetical protein
MHFTLLASAVVCQHAKYSHGRGGSHLPTTLRTFKNHPKLTNKNKTLKCSELGPKESKTYLLQARTSASKVIRTGPSQQAILRSWSAEMQGEELTLFQMVSQVQHTVNSQSIKLYIANYLTCPCGLCNALKLIGIWSRPACCGLLIISPGQKCDFEKLRRVYKQFHTSTNCQVYKPCATTWRTAARLCFFGKHTSSCFFVDTYLLLFSALGQYLAIQPADCGHQKYLLSTGLRRAALRPCGLFDWLPEYCMHNIWQQFVWDRCENKTHKLDMIL